MTWIEREMRHASHLQLLSGNIFHVNLFNTTKKSALVRIICGCCFYSQIYEENVHLLESTGSENTLFSLVK